MRWFRFYTEVLDDPKVQTLSGDEVKCWVNCLCIGAKHEGRLPATKEIAWALRISEPVAAEFLEALIDAGLIDRDGDELSIHGWKSRQYRDDSAERVRRFRERQAETPKGKESVTPPVTVTPPPTVTPTVTDCVSPSVYSVLSVQEVSGKRGSGGKTKNVEVLSPFEAKVNDVAVQIHHRHPKLRSCGITEVRDSLRTISKQFPVAERIAKLDEINSVHQAWCEDEQWIEEGGKFAKGLDNWLRPTKERWKVLPPERNGHAKRPLSKSERSFGEASAFFSAMNPEYE